MAELKPFAEFLREEIPNFVVNQNCMSYENFHEKDIQSCFKNGFDVSNVIAYYDEGNISTSRLRVCFTNNAIYSVSRFSKQHTIIYSEIGKTYLNEEKKTLKVEIGDNDVIEIDWGNNFDKSALENFFNKIRSYATQDLIHESDQIQTIEDLSQEARCIYAKILVNQTYVDDKHIDAQELSELHLLMAQIKLNSEKRREIMEYIQAHDKERDELWAELCSMIPNGAEKSLSVSLLKDMIRIDKKTSDNKTVFYNNYISDFAKQNEFEQDEVDIFQKIIELDFELINGEISETAYRKKIEEYQNSLGKHYPLKALWMTGSITGLASSVILSRLALFVPGLGIIATGFTVFQGIKGLLKLKDDYIGVQKRYFINKIMEMNQVTLRNITEDIKVIGERLIDLTNEVNLNKDKIAEIQYQFSLYISSMSDRSQGEEYAE